MATHLVAFVQHVPVGGSPGPSTGQSVALSIMLCAAVAIAAGLFAVALGTSRRWSPAGGALLVVAAAAVVPGAGRTLLVGLHLTAVSLWSGAVLCLVALTVRGRAAVLQRARALSFWGVGAAATAVTTGVLLSRSEGVRAADLTTTAFGRLVTFKVALVVIAVAIGLAHRRTAVPSRAVALVRTEALALAVALALGSALASTPLRRAVVELGPGLAVVDLGRDGHATLFVATSGRSTFLVLLSNEPVAVTDLFARRTLQAAPGLSLPVEADNGRVSLRVLSGQSQEAVKIAPARVPDAGTATTDELLQGGLGALLGSGHLGTTATPSCSNVTGWGRTSAALIDRAGPVRLVTDGTARSRSFLEGARSAGLQVSPAAPTVLLVLDKARALRWLTAPEHAQAIYLAPWLLDRDVLAVSAQRDLPPLTVVAPADAMSPAADRYRQDLALLGGGLAPSAAGLQAYLTASGRTAPARAALFAATPVGFLPGVLDDGHPHAGSASWVPGGSLVQVSRSRPVPCASAL